jgi:hypothetical protein
MKFKKQKGFGLIGIIIALAVVILAGGGGVYWKERTQNQKSLLQNGNDAVKKAEDLKAEIEEQNEPVVDESVADTSNWKMYRNEKYGFEVKYPESITLKKDIKVECAMGMGPATFKTIIYKAGTPIPMIFRSHIEEEVLFAGTIHHQSDECVNNQLTLILFRIISKPENFAGLEAYVNNEIAKAKAFESKWPSAAGQSFSVKQEMIGDVKAFVFTSSGLSVLGNTHKTIYLEQGNNIYFMNLDYSAAYVGLLGDQGVDDNSVFMYQTAQKIIKTFMFIN